MNIKHISTVIPVSSSLSLGTERIVACAWSPSNVKLAVCRRDRAIYCYDEKGELKDKFTTRAGDSNKHKGSFSYSVTALAFSPDSVKIAIAQTDQMIYVYRVGEDFRQKKSITHKLGQPSGVVSLVWPNDNEIFCSLSDGKIRHIPLLGAAKGPRGKTIYNPDAYNIALVTSYSGTELASSHTDNRIALFSTTDDDGPVLIAVIRHSCPAFATAIGIDSIVAGGCDKKIAVYDKQGKVRQMFDYTQDENQSEFTVAVTNPTGHAVLFGSYNSIKLLHYNSRKRIWEEGKTMHYPNMYSITSAAWRKNGTLIAIGTGSGCLYYFEALLKRSKRKNFETTYVSPSHVVVKPNGMETSANIKSKYGGEIMDIRLMGKNRYVVGRTPDTLLLCDLARNLTSEVPWSETEDKEKFYFDNPNVCMIFNTGEMILVEYGKNEILGTFSTELVNPHLISVRINERIPKKNNNNIDRTCCKKLAYLLDLKTIAVMDLEYSLTLGQINHDSKIDWLELNETGSKLLFRDRRLRLFLLEVDSFNKFTLLQVCHFVQWVPGSDVVVAQSKGVVRVWYNLDTPEQNVDIEVKGRAFDVITENHRTLVMIQDGGAIHEIPLDESRIEFASAIDDGDFVRAIDFLESCEPSMETTAMWKNLSKIALEAKQLATAERAFCAAGDHSKSKFLKDTLILAEQVESQNLTEPGKGTKHYMIEARIAILEGQLKTAEAIYLNNNDVDNAIKMHELLHSYEDAISLAQAKNHPQLKTLIDNYLRQLVASGQFELAAEFMDKNGNSLYAIQLFIEGGLPTKAMKVVESHPELEIDAAIIDLISGALLQGDFYEEAGEFFEIVGEKNHALECYRKGNSFDKAVKLAKSVFPDEVVELENEWGDYLSANRQIEAAANHYIEAGRLVKALDAAIESRQWKKAFQIIEAVDESDEVSHHFEKLGDHYSSIGELKTAEDCYVRGGMPMKAMEMYSDKGEWEEAHKVSTRHNLVIGDMQEKYIHQASILCEQGNVHQAEKLFISIGLPDQAIQMYNKRKMYEDMMRLIQIYHPDHVNPSYLHVAQILKKDEDYKAAEYYFLKGGLYQEALNMYQDKGLWEDAYRVARANGSQGASQQIIYMWANSLGGETAVRLLRKFGLVKQCIEYMCSNGVFHFAEEVARLGSPDDLPYVHLEWGRSLEENQKFSEAREHYLQSSSPAETIEMYIRADMLPDALESAERHMKEELPRVLLLYAKRLFEQQKFSQFEAVVLRAERPDVAIESYKRQNMWSEAFKLCQQYAPHYLQQLQIDYDMRINEEGDPKDPQLIINQGKEWERLGDHKRAIECYLKLNESIVDNPAILTKFWVKAADLGFKFLKIEQAIIIVRLLGPLLINIQSYAEAAQIYSQVGLNQNSVDALIAGDLWSDAKKAARNIGPKMEEYVKKRHTEVLKTTGQVEELEDVNLAAALDLLCEQGKWTMCLDRAKKHNSMLVHYEAKYVTYLLTNSAPVEALGVYCTYGVPCVKQHFPLYRALPAMLFIHADQDDYATWYNLRDVLHEVVKAMKDSRDVPSQVYTQFEETLWVAHFFVNRVVFNQTDNLTTLGTKISVALLRYCGIIPVDKAFYDAGIACIQAGWDGMALTFLNHYLDIHDAILDGKTSTVSLDNSDFVCTDIPTDCNLPDRNTVPSDKHDEIKEWVLTASMDRTIVQELRTDERGVYEASVLNGIANEEVLDQCLVTGYPVMGTQRVTFRIPHRSANKEDWNKFVMASKSGDNASKLTDILEFITRWCGSNPQYSF